MIDLFRQHDKAEFALQLFESTKFKNGPLKNYINSIESHYRLIPSAKQAEVALMKETDESIQRLMSSYINIVSKLDFEMEKASHPISSREKVMKAIYTVGK